MDCTLYARVFTCRRVADDSRAVDFDPQAVLEDVKKLLGVKGDGDSGQVDSSSDVSDDGDSDASSLDGLGKLDGSHSTAMQCCHTPLPLTHCPSLCNTCFFCRGGPRNARHYV